ncbi:MAG: formylglycine-generating enzyme family protein, partial [Verrucomicrobiae bacterium]|nr:formylglycine-generating enzyme family protein [Verrucomicrobiae bacterium]
YTLTCAYTEGGVSKSATFTATVTSAGVKEDVDLGGGVTLSLVPIPAGTFTMGCPSTEPGYFGYEWPPHQVTLTKGFYMGTTEVTQAQWLKVMGSWPGPHPQGGYGLGDAYPAYYIDWFDAVNFCNKLSANKGLTPCYTNSSGSTTIAEVDTVTLSTTANGYRLPTEAEWEYACRAGTTTMFYWSATYEEAQMKEYCWYQMNTVYGYYSERPPAWGNTQPVGTRLPNAWGLYDMSGNLWEWCNDWYESPSARGDQLDPQGPITGSDHVFRGGGWSSRWNSCRSAGRAGSIFRVDCRGFRVVRTIP